jgi:transcriptional regulator with XRE-family HTH domain
MSRIERRIERTYNPDPLWIARKRKGLTQEEVAKALNVSRATISRAETMDESVDPDTLRKICDYLEISFAKLKYREKFLLQVSHTS